MGEGMLETFGMDGVYSSVPSARVSSVSSLGVSSPIKSSPSEESSIFPAYS